MFLYAFLLLEGITAVEAQGLFAPLRCRHRKLPALPHKNRGVRKLLTAPMISFWEKWIGRLGSHENHRPGCLMGMTG